MRRATETSDLDRREFLTAFAALSGASLLAACGESRAGPPLSQVSAPTVRVRLGAPRARAQLRLSAGGWDIAGERGSPYALRQASSLDATLSLSASGIALGGTTRARPPCACARTTLSGSTGEKTAVMAAPLEDWAMARA